MKGPQAAAQMTLFPSPPIRRTERQVLRDVMKDLISGPLAAVKKGELADVKCPSCDHPRAIVRIVHGARMLVTCENKSCKYTFRTETPVLKF